MTIEHATTHPSTDPPEEHRRRWRLWWLALVLAIAALVTVAVTVTRQTDDPQVERGAQRTSPNGEVAAPGNPDAIGPATGAPPSEPSGGPGTPVDGGKPTPTRSPFENGDKVMSGVDPQALMKRLTQRWKLQTNSNPYFGSATRQSGTAGEPASGTRQVTLIIDQEKRLRRVYCAASGPGNRLLTSEGRQFIGDCALGALGTGTDRDSLDAWLDRRNTTGASGQPDREEGQVGDYLVVLIRAPGLVGVELTRPA